VNGKQRRKAIRNITNRFPQLAEIFDMAANLVESEAKDEATKHLREAAQTCLRWVLRFYARD
jgi:hypothetical protein